MFSLSQPDGPRVAMKPSICFLHGALNAAVRTLESSDLGGQLVPRRLQGHFNEKLQRVIRAVQSRK